MGCGTSQEGVEDPEKGGDYKDNDGESEYPFPLKSFENFT